MPSTHATQSQDNNRLPAADGASDGNRPRLEEILRVSRIWLAQPQVSATQRESLIRLGVLAEHLGTANDHSPSAMEAALALMCGNCLCLDATRGQCLGRPEDRCLLLTGTTG